MDQPNSSQHLPLLGPHVDALTVVDNITILNQIFSDLDSLSLFRVALACKRFKDPALDILWCSLNSLLPLLMILRPFRLTNKTYIFRGPFDDEAWPIFDAYARRVKQLTLTTNDGEKFACTAIERLTKRRPCLFPSLRDLVCSLVTPTNTPLFSLLSPTLERLELGGDQVAYDEVIEPAMSTVIHESESSRLGLKQLVLCVETPPTSLFSSLCRLSNLIQLSISAPVTFEFFEEVGQLKYLEDLTIVLSNPPNLPACVCNPGFERLRILNVTSPCLPLRAALERILTIRLSSISFKAIQDKNLAPKRILKKHENKRVKKRQPLTLLACGVFAECFNLLSSRWGRSLRSIILSASPHHGGVPSLLDLFTPSRFERLERLQFHEIDLRPTDSGIRSLAQACPNLQQLRLPIGVPESLVDPRSVSVHCNATFGESPNEIVVSDGTATIVSLCLLAKLCPKLTYLEIGLDITTIPPFSDDNVRSHGLSNLSVGSHVGSTHASDIARHIYRLFPNLKIQSHDGFNSTSWEQIGHTIDTYRKIVTDENTRRSKQCDRQIFDPLKD